MKDKYSHLSFDEKKELIKLLEEKKKRESGVLLNFEPSVIQRAICSSKAKVAMVSGGNRAGKSEIGAVVTSIAATGILPLALQSEGDFSHLLCKGRIWCSGLDTSVARDVIQEKLDRFFPPDMIDRFNEEKKIYYFKDGSPRSKDDRVGLKTAESKAGKYQGTSRKIIWLDEEHPKEIYDECYERTVDCEGRILMTFSPIQGLTWSNEHIYKRARKIFFTKNTLGIKEEVGVVHTVEEIEQMQDQKNRKLHCRVNNDPNTIEGYEVYIITKYDNIHLKASEIRDAEIKNAADPSQYNARILGAYTRVSGNCVFLTKKILEQQTRVSTTFKVGDIKRNKFIPSPEGSLTIYEEVKPGKCYVIGADWGQGIPEGDNTVFVVYDHLTRRQVAEWVGKIPPEEAAISLAELGTYYNYAQLIPENNGIGYAACVKLKENKKYPNSRIYSRNPNKDGLVQGVPTKKKVYGFRTGHDTKPVLEQNMNEALRTERIVINSYEALEEMLSYVYHEEGNMNKTGAKKGCKDDRAVANLLALQGILKLRPSSGSARPTGTQNSNSDPMTGY